MEQAKSKPFRYSAQQKQDFLSEYKASGVSVKEFCRAHGMSEGAFRKWQMREREKNGRQGNKPENIQSPATGFAELKITRPLAAQPVLYAEIRSIRIYQQVPASYLKELQS